MIERNKNQEGRLTMIERNKNVEFKLTGLTDSIRLALEHKPEDEAWSIIANVRTLLEGDEDLQEEHAYLRTIEEERALSGRAILALIDLFGHAEHRLGAGV